MITNMNTKTILSGVLALFLMLVVVQSVFAADITASTSDRLTQSKNSTSFVLTVSGNGTLNINLPSQVIIKDDDNNEVIVTLTANRSLNSVPAGMITVQANLTSWDDDFWYTDESQTITITASDSESNATKQATTSLRFLRTYCEAGFLEGSKLTIRDITDEEKENTDAWDWKPGDNVEITVDIRNIDDDEVDGVIEYGLYDFTNDEFVLEESQDFSLDDGDSDEFTLSFEVPSKDLSEDDYHFMVKVYNDDEDEDVECDDRFASDSYYEEVSIEREKHDVTLNDFQISNPLQCGTTANILATLDNIGKEDQDKIRTILTIDSLGIKKEVIVNNLDSGDDKGIVFDVLIPDTYKEGTYKGQVTVEFDYDDSSYDEKRNSLSFDAIITGDCKLPQVAEIILDSSAIQSGGKAGDQLVVRATIMNPASTVGIYTIQATGYDSWADSATVSPNSFSLNGKESEEVTITLDTQDTSVGSQTFTLRTVAGDGTVTEQPIIIELSKV